MVLGCAWQPGAGVWGGHTRTGGGTRWPGATAGSSREAGSWHPWVLMEVRRIWGGTGEFLRPRRQQFFEAEGFRGGFVFPL